LYNILCSLLLFNSLLNLSDKEIVVNLNRPITQILKNTLAVMSTVGEWQLIDITAHKESDAGFMLDELIFYVCLPFLCSGIIK
jgi:hypothetical protein